jgi:hypothetical protein
MPYKDKNKGKERIKEKRLDPIYKEKEKQQRIIKMSTPEEKERRKKYKQSVKGKIVNKRYKQSEKGKRAYLKSHLKRHYGILIEDLEKMLKTQNNRCSLCGDNFTEVRSYVVDHNHKTGVVRGLIHRQCNVLIGLANDNIDILKMAINYLELDK